MGPKWMECQVPPTTTWCTIAVPSYFRLLCRPQYVLGSRLSHPFFAPAISDSDPHCPQIQPAAYENALLFAGWRRGRIALPRYMPCELLGTFVRSERANLSMRETKGEGVYRAAKIPLILNLSFLSRIRVLYIIPSLQSPFPSSPSPSPGGFSKTTSHPQTR